MEVEQNIEYYKIKNNNENKKFYKEKNSKLKIF